MAKDLVTFGCGAGTQSTALYFLMRDGVVPKPDAAIFADTGDEPNEVYETVRFLAGGFREIDVPFYVVGRDPHVSLMRDVLDRQVYATLPAFTTVETKVMVPLWWDRCGCDWGRVFGIGGERGVRALRQYAPGVTAREIAGHPDTHVGAGDCALCTGERDDERSCPDDEIALLMLAETGLDAVPAPHRQCRAEGRIVTRSHTYTKLERGRIKREWQRAVAFDRAFRTMPGLRGKRYLHASRRPLDEAPIDKPTADELASAQGDLLRALEEGSPSGCSPYACRSGEPDAGPVQLGLPALLSTSDRHGDRPRHPRAPNARTTR